MNYNIYMGTSQFNMRLTDIPCIFRVAKYFQSLVAVGTGITYREVLETIYTQLTVFTSDNVCRSIRNVQFRNDFFYTTRLRYCFVLFVIITLTRFWNRIGSLHALLCAELERAQLRCSITHTSDNKLANNKVCVMRMRGLLFASLSRLKSA